MNQNLPAMDSPSVMFAHLLDNIVVETDYGAQYLVCNTCAEMVCEVEHDDTMRVLLNTVLQHVCGET